MNIKSVLRKEIAEFYYHPEFDAKTGDNDVGLVMIKGTFSGDYADPIPIINYKLSAGQLVIASGWGETKVCSYLDP